MAYKHIIVFFFILLWFTASPVCAVFPPGEVNGSGYGPATHSRVPEDPAPGERSITELVPAKGRLLVATRRLKGSMFEESVILLIEYSRQGATGLIINKPHGAAASEVFPDIKELADHKEKVYLGGPVELGRVNLLIRADKRPAESENILPDVYFSSSMNALKEAAGSEEKGLKFRMYFGYSGWSQEQIEQEIRRGSWYVMEGDQGLIFSDTPALIWQKLIRKRAPLLDTVFRGSDVERLTICCVFNQPHPDVPETRRPCR